MRVRTWARLFLGAWLLAGQVAPAQAQFNPQGRSKKKTGPVRPTGPSSGPRKPPENKPPGAQVQPGTQPPDEGASGKKAGPSSDALIARYLGIALSQPGTDFPLQRLSELYRERDGKLDALLSELERRTPDKADRYGALCALAGIQKLDGKADRAVETYERAIAERPDLPAAELALGRLYEQQGQKSKARERFVAALPHVTGSAEQELVLRSLIMLSLDLDDFAAARQYHAQLVKRAQGSFFVRSELGRELMNRGKYEQAAEELRDVVKAAAGDHRVLAPALRDLGVALARADHKKEALVELEKALKVAGQSAGVRREIYSAIAEVYRADERIPELVARLEKEAFSDADELRLLASLYEETGRLDKALATYRRVLKIERGDLSSRLKVVQLLEVQGSLDQAVGEYEALIQAAPRNPDYVFRLAETLMQRGERARALSELQKLEARSGDDDQTLAALVDFYERVGDHDRSLALLQRLAGTGATDPQHIIELGTRYWEAGDKKRAVSTWKRLEHVVGDRGQALLMLGEIYLEHDMPKEALEALAEATKKEPKQPRFRKAYALALERMGGAAGTREQRQALYDEAYKMWDQLLRDSSTPRELQRDARQHMVTLWNLGGQLAQRTAGLERRLNAKPPDLEAGRLLGEAYQRLRSYTDAERVLRRVSAAVPADIEVLTQLERVLVLERHLEAAIEILQKLAELEPNRAREHYQRMAGYASELYRDEDAVRYAARAVELSPDDAEGHKKLGEMYRQRQDNSKAIAEFRQAIAKNERLFPVYLELAELLLGNGEIEEADQLLRRVVRATPDEELLIKAARLSMQVNLGRGSLESLERDLLPLALNNPERPVYRRLLVEIYGAMAYPIVHRLKSSNPKQAEEARQALQKIGVRAVKPLLDALSDARDTQQTVAMTLLMYVANPSAAPALFAYATGDADSNLRARAMLALGLVEDPNILSRLSDVLAPGGHVRSDESDPVVLAAAWSVARMRSKSAGPLLASLLKSEAPSLRALGALGLGALGDTRYVRPLADLGREQDAGPVARAAAAYALGALGATSEADVLTELSLARDPTLRAAALIALARVKAPAAPDVIAQALLAVDADLRRAADAAALVFSTGKYLGSRAALPLPEDRVDVKALIEELRPSGYSDADRVEALTKLTPALERASLSAAQSSPARARAVLDALGLGAEQGLPELVRGTKPQDVGPRIKSSVEDIAQKLVMTFVALAQHPSAEDRIMAVRFLGARHQDDARRAVIAALLDRDASVRRAALLAAPEHDPEAVAAAAQALTQEQDWALRAEAAQTLGRIAQNDGNPSARAALARVAESDEYALVREAAARALAAVDAKEARIVLTRMASADPEPLLREAARRLLSEKK